MEGYDVILEVDPDPRLWLHDICPFFQLNDQDCITEIHILSIAYIITVGETLSLVIPS